MALVISKHIEIKTDVSIRRFLAEAKRIAGGQNLNRMTGKTVPIKAEPTEKMRGLVGKLFPPH